MQWFPGFRDMAKRRFSKAEFLKTSHKSRMGMSLVSSMDQLPLLLSALVKSW